MSLDKNILQRDSIFLAGENQQMSGLFSSLKKKIKKVTRKVGKAVLPKKVYKKLSQFETKHRKDIKKIGAVAAVATGAYFAGPAIYKFGAQQLSGKGVVGSAIKKFGASKVRKQATNYLRDKAKSKLMGKISPSANPQVKANAAIQYALNRRIPNPQQQEVFTQQMQRLPAARVLQNPVVADIGRDVASYEARKKYATRDPYQREAVNILAKEGAIEVEHQTDKKAGPDYMKYAIPAGGAILAALIAKS